VQLIQSQSDFLSFLRDEAMSNGNLSIRGAERCCGVANNALIKGVDFRSEKLGQILTTHGFQAVDLVENGFPPQAVWLTIEYFAFESKAAAPMAKQLARTFGSIGIKATLEQLNQKPQPSLKPVRDTIDWLNASDRIANLTDPILKSYLTQSLYEDLGAIKALPSADIRLAPIAVLAREKGYRLKPGQESQLGRFAKKHLEPKGTAPHGRYAVNIYEDSEQTNSILEAFFHEC
jgi:hypothetical protein